MFLFESNGIKRGRWKERAYGNRWSSEEMGVVVEVLILRFSDSCSDGVGGGTFGGISRLIDDE